MAIRKVKNAIDLTTNELIYFKGHAKATYMSDGKTVEDAIIQIGAEGGIVAETDPIFSASPAASITESKKREWDNKVDKVSGKRLSTEDFTTALKRKLEGLSNYDDTTLSNALSTLRGDFDKLVSGDTTTAIKTFNEVIAFLDGLTDTQDLESIIASIEQQIAGKMDKVTLATVATSGSYNDLSNKPTIPSAVTESTVSGWGFTKNTGTYSKPSGGIPKSDLTSEVQTSLGKADTALQSYTEQYKGTITGVSANGTSVATSGVANIPAASTSKYGVTKLSSATNSTSTTLAATASAVKSAYDLANGKQDKLVSGTNIKTVNGTSILGSGDITISGGSSDANVQAVDTGDVLDNVNVEYATTAYVDNKVANISLTNYATIAYVDGLVGDINSVLESIISGGVTSIFPIDLHVGDNGDAGISLYNHIVQHQDNGYCVFEENEIVTYNNTKIPHFYYNGYECYNDIEAGRLLLSSLGVVYLESFSGGGGS